MMIKIARNSSGNLSWWSILQGIPKDFYDDDDDGDDDDDEDEDDDDDDDDGANYLQSQLLRASIMGEGKPYPC